MSAAGLHDPAEHRPLAGPPWSEAAAASAIAEIAADAVSGYRGPLELWPNHPDEDFDEAAAGRPYRSLYLGAAGMAWALHRLAADGLAAPLPGIDALARTLPGDFLAAPELTELETGTPPPPPSLLFGETGILVAVDAILGAGDPDADSRRERLLARATANADNPAHELCWGAPGTMLATLAGWRRSGDPRLAERWRADAARLLAAWADPVWEQHLYGERRAFVGAGHGFAGNAASLLAGAELLPDADATALRTRTAQTLARLAQTADDTPGESPIAQWPAFADRVVPRRPVQWCHGSPGIVVSLAPHLPASPETDALLRAGGELTWRAGPLRKGVGLCHGTAGNGWALLALAARTGEDRWLERARAFAMDAAADVAARRGQLGRGRYTLFTGDLGVALLLAACREPIDPRFPFLDPEPGR